MLESCKLYLKILLAYLRTDNEKKDRIRRKYKDLQYVDRSFLCLSISLTLLPLV